MARNLLELAKAQRPSSRYKGFMEKLSLDDQQQIIELVDAYLAGELEGEWSVSGLHRRILVPNGYKFSSSTFRKWVSEYVERKEASKSSQSGEVSTTQKRKAGTKR